MQVMYFYILFPGSKIKTTLTCMSHSTSGSFVVFLCHILQSFS